MGRGLRLVGLAGVVLPAPLGTNASAETTNLTCSSSASPGLAMAVTLDLTGKPAAFGDEPATATNFTDTDVSWQVDYTQAGTEINASCQLSRATGALTRDLVEMGNTNGQQKLEYGRDVAKNKFQSHAVRMTSATRPATRSSRSAPHC